MPVLPQKRPTSNPNRESRIALIRFIALAGVASSILLSAVLFVSAFVSALHQSYDALRALGREESVEKLIVASVRHADMLLIATAMLIIGIGLYSIFIGRAEGLPKWLAIRRFEDLKEKLTSVVVVALAVDFFTVALDWKGSSDIIAIGVAIAAVLLGLSAYTLAHGSRHRTGPADGAGTAHERD